MSNTTIFETVQLSKEDAEVLKMYYQGDKVTPITGETSSCVSYVLHPIVKNTQDGLFKFNIILTNGKAIDILPMNVDKTYTDNKFFVNIEKNNYNLKIKPHKELDQFNIFVSLKKAEFGGDEDDHKIVSIVQTYDNGSTVLVDPIITVTFKDTTVYQAPLTTQSINIVNTNNFLKVLIDQQEVYRYNIYEYNYIRISSVGKELNGFNLTKNDL